MKSSAAYAAKRDIAQRSRSPNKQGVCVTVWTKGVTCTHNEWFISMCFNTTYPYCIVKHKKNTTAVQHALFSQYFGLWTCGTILRSPMSGSLIVYKIKQNGSCWAPQNACNKPLPTTYFTDWYTAYFTELIEHILAAHDWDIVFFEYNLARTVQSNT